MSKVNINWLIILITICSEILIVGYLVLDYSVEVINKVLTLIIMSIISVIEYDYLSIKRNGVLENG